MHAAALVGEDMSEEQALIDLVALLGALLHQRTLFLEPLGRRQQRRIAGGCRHHQLGNAQAARAVAGEFVVDRNRVAAEEALLDRAGAWP